MPEFQAAYLDARCAAFRRTAARLQQGTSATATTLLKTIIDPATPATVRLRVAVATLNHAAKAIEIEDNEACVAAFEAATTAGWRCRRRPSSHSSSGTAGLKESCWSSSIPPFMDFRSGV